MSNKKDICPICNTNQKGIKSKSCRPCSIKALSSINKVAEEHNKLLTKESNVAQIGVGLTATVTDAQGDPIHTANTVISSVDRAHQEAVDSTAVGVNIEPEPEPETLEPAEPSRPIRVGDTTPDGQFYL